MTGFVQTKGLIVKILFYWNEITCLFVKKYMNIYIFNVNINSFILQRIFSGFLPKGEKILKIKAFKRSNHVLVLILFIFLYLVQYSQQMSHFLSRKQRIFDNTPSLFTTFRCAYTGVLFVDQHCLGGGKGGHFWSS